MFTILMLAAEKSKDTFLAPIGIGLSLFVVQIAGVNYSGSSVNPARSFGPCAASANFPEYHWIYWLGPMMGAIIAAGFYHLIKVFAKVMILRDVYDIC
jgi:aquaporin related protein